MTRKTQHDIAHGRQADTSTSTAPPSWTGTLGLPWGAQGRAKGHRRGLATGGGCTYEWHKRNWKDGYRTPRNTGRWVVHATLPGSGRDKGTERGKNFFTAVRPLVITFSPAVDRRRRIKTYRAGPTQLAPTNTTTKRTPARNKSDCANAKRQGTNAKRTDRGATDTTAHHKKPLQRTGSDHQQTARTRANIKLGGRAWAGTRTTSNELPTPWQATPADHHDHEHSGTPQLYHRGRDQPTFTNCPRLHFDKPRNN